MHNFKDHVFKKIFSFCSYKLIVAAGSPGVHQGVHDETPEDL